MSWDCHNLEKGYSMLNKNKVIFEKIPHSSYAIYDPKPSMFLNENYLPELYVNQIPPKHEISRTMNGNIHELDKNKRKVIEKDMKNEIKNVAKLFLKGGMKRVICAMYPIIIFQDSKDGYMIATMDFCMVAYKD